MWNKILSKLNIIRGLLWLAAVTVMFLILPHPDRQSYSYELEQPWRYPLLTADFDMPILRDSASANAMRDSIDRTFIPFVQRNPQIAQQNIERFKAAISQNSPVASVSLLSGLLTNVYSRGIVEASVYEKIHQDPSHRLRISENDADENAVITINGTDMLSPKRAFLYIDSAYMAASGADSHLDENIIKALNVCLTPNIIIDTVADNKYRSQEYLNVNGALGVIKKGQKIVDRGEIVTPQIFTNLNTYTEMLVTRENDTQQQTYFTAGQALYIAIVFTILYLFLHIYRSSFFGDVRKMIFLISFISIFCIFAVIMVETVAAGLYLVPFATVPVVIMIFFDARTAIFALLTTILISALVATYQFSFIFLELLAGLCATFSIHQLSKRSQLLRTAFISFAAYTVGYVAITLLGTGLLDDFSWRMIGYFAINSVILSFAYIFILMLEKIFGFTSMVTLVELSDINNPILRQLAEQAPGTFQHSMQVSMLAAEGARAIGANTQLVRTGALYHDIGKMESPIFFTENQHGVNPHEGLDPETSAQKIISHVTEGLRIASRAKLPSVIKDFISQHHGRSLTRYFYNTAVNNNPEVEIDKTKFQYPGPNPQTKETAILMMADCVEAASRSLKDYSATSIGNLVDNIVNSQINEGLFKESNISFRDIETVKETFKKRLATIYHSRVAYPKINKGNHDNTNSSEEEHKSTGLKI